MNKTINDLDTYIDELSNKSSSKYKSKKASKQIMILSKPNISQIKLTKEDIDKIKKKKMGNELIKFRKKLYKNIGADKLNLLNKNLLSLKVKIRYLAPEVLLLKLTAGSYNIQKNKVKVLKSHEKETINHELLHMATSFYDKKGKVGFCGFQQILEFREEVIGRGLNEGYTELLSRRYFKQNNDNLTLGYNVCMFFAEKLEEMIGKEKMEEFYFNTDLMGLYKYLKNFDESSNIGTFIVILDNLISKRFILEIENDPEYELASCYLSKWFINKKQIDLNNNLIDKDTFDEEVSKYIYSLIDIDSLEKEYSK